MKLQKQSFQENKIRSVKRHKLIKLTEIKGVTIVSKNNRGVGGGGRLPEAQTTYSL